MKSRHSQREEFYGMSEAEFDAHMARNTYDNFVLTEAVRPGRHFRPSEGYRLDTYVDRQSNIHVPVIMAAATREKLFDLFLDIAGVIGDEVEVVVETSHYNEAHNGDHTDHLCNTHENIILQSKLGEFRELLLDDGCLGIAVFNSNEPCEVQFDDHKLIVVYASDLARFQNVLHKYDVPFRPDMRFITEQGHAHSTTEENLLQVENLLHVLGKDMSDGESELDLPDDINDADWWKTGGNPYGG